MGTGRLSQRPGPVRSVYPSDLKMIGNRAVEDRRDYSRADHARIEDREARPVAVEGLRLFRLDLELGSAQRQAGSIFCIRSLNARDSMYGLERSEICAG